MNVTTYENETRLENVTIRENVTVLENRTTFANVSYQVNQTVTTNVTTNVTYDVVYNVTYNVTTNVTFNETTTLHSSTNYSEQAPVDVVVALDASGSVNNLEWADENEAARALLSGLRDEINSSLYAGMAQWATDSEVYVEMQALVDESGVASYDVPVSQRLTGFTWYAQALVFEAARTNRVAA